MTTLQGPRPSLRVTTCRQLYFSFITQGFRMSVNHILTVLSVTTDLTFLTGKCPVGFYERWKSAKKEPPDVSGSDIFRKQLYRRTGSKRRRHCRASLSLYWCHYLDWNSWCGVDWMIWWVWCRPDGNDELKQDKRCLFRDLMCFFFFFSLS